MVQKALEFLQNSNIERINSLDKKTLISSFINSGEILYDEETNLFSKNTLNYFLEGIPELKDKSQMNMALIELKGLKKVNEMDNCKENIKGGHVEGDKYIKIFHTLAQQVFDINFNQTNNKNITIQFEHDKILLLMPGSLDLLKEKLMLFEEVTNYINTTAYFDKNNPMHEISIIHEESDVKDLNNPKKTLNEIILKLPQEKDKIKIFFDDLGNIVKFDVDENGTIKIKDNDTIPSYDITKIDFRHKSKFKTNIDSDKQFAQDYTEKYDNTKAILTKNKNYFELKTIEELQIIYKEHVQDLLIDPLTKFYKKIYTDYVLNLPESKGKSVINIDVNDLRLTNILKGDVKGNTLLESTAKIIAKHFNNQSDVLIRNGGDEFLIVTDKPELFDEVLIDIAEYNSIKSNDVKINLAHSTTQYTHETPEELMEESDKTMQLDKEGKKQRKSTDYLILDEENPELVVGFISDRKYQELYEPVHLSKIPNLHSYMSSKIQQPNKEEELIEIDYFEK